MSSYLKSGEVCLASHLIFLHCLSTYFYYYFLVIMLMCAPVHKAYIALTAHPVLCAHFGFNIGILTVSRQYPTPVSIKWKCVALLV